MSLTFCKLTDSGAIIFSLIAISRLSADIVNNTYYFYKYICRLASFRNTGPLNSPFTSRTHWHPFAAPNYNNLSVLFCIFSMTTQKITRFSEYSCSGTCIMLILIILVKRRRRTPLQAGGACEAPPHENRIRLISSKSWSCLHRLKSFEFQQIQLPVCIFFFLCSLLFNIISDYVSCNAITHCPDISTITPKFSAP